MKNTLNGINIRFAQDRTVQSETKTEKSWEERENKQCIGNLCDNIKQFNIGVIGAPGKKVGRGRGTEKVFEDIVCKISSNVIKTGNPQIQKTKNKC